MYKDYIQLKIKSKYSKLKGGKGSEQIYFFQKNIRIAYKHTHTHTHTHIYIRFNIIIHSVQFSCSAVSDSLRPRESQHTRPPLSITNSQSSPKLMSIKSVMPSSHLILCRPFLLLPPNPSQHQSLFQ